MGKLTMSLLMTLLCVGAARAAEPADKSLSKQEAIAIAEKFVAAQGAAAALQPKAAGARLESDLWFVGFRATSSESIRGVVVNAKNSSAKMVNQNLKMDWLDGVEPKAAAPEPAKPVVKKGAKAPAKTPAASELKKKKAAAKTPAH